MIQKIKNLYKNYQPFLIDYILMNTFNSFLLFKLNNFFFKFDFIYIFFLAMIITIIFKNFCFNLANKIKNTYIFNFLLYYDLIFKNFIYKCFYNFDDRMGSYLHKKINIFFRIYTFSSIFCYCFFSILLYSNIDYNILNTFLSLLFFLIGFFNLIEKQFIFNIQIDENNHKNDNKIIKNFDYKYIQNILKIENNSFQKNKSFFYVQRRYAVTSTAKEVLTKGAQQTKDYGIPSAIGALVTTAIMTVGLKMESDKVQSEKDKVALDEKKVVLDEKKVALDALKFKTECEEKKEKAIRQAHNDSNKLSTQIKALQDDEINSSSIFHKISHTNEIRELEKQKEYFDTILKNSNINVVPKNLNDQINTSSSVTSDTDTNKILLKKIKYIAKSSMEDFFI